MRYLLALIAIACFFLCIRAICVAPVAEVIGTYLMTVVATLAAVAWWKRG